MSTSFYRLQPPVTHLRLEEGIDLDHDLVAVWVNHQLSGHLYVNAGQGWTLCSVFASMTVAATRINTGNGKTKLIFPYKRPREEETLVSDHGDITTLGELIREMR